MCSLISREQTHPKEESAIAHPYNFPRCYPKFRQDLPSGQSKGDIIVITDYPSLAGSHAINLNTQGWTVYSAVCCTDIQALYTNRDFMPRNVKAVVLTTEPRGWHGQEGEKPPPDLPRSTNWRVMNITYARNLVTNKQGRPPLIIIASYLIESDFFPEITESNLTQAGINYQTYNSSDPLEITQIIEPTT